MQAGLNVCRDGQTIGIQYKALFLVQCSTVPSGTSSASTVQRAQCRGVRMASAALMPPGVLVTGAPAPTHRMLPPTSLQRRNPHRHSFVNDRVFNLQWKSVPHMSSLMLTITLHHHHRSSLGSSWSIVVFSSSAGFPIFNFFIVC